MSERDAVRRLKNSGPQGASLGEDSGGSDGESVSAADSPTSGTAA